MDVIILEIRPTLKKEVGTKYFGMIGPQGKQLKNQWMDITDAIKHMYLNALYLYLNADITRFRWIIAWLANFIYSRRLDEV